MNLVPSISGTNDFSDIVQSHGYRLTPASAANLPPFVADLFLVLQFGNDADASADESLPTAVDCAVRLRGAYPAIEMRRWMIRKSFISRFKRRKFELTFLLDAGMVGNPAPAHFRQRLAETVSHVRLLVGDVRGSLLNMLAQDRGRGPHVSAGPAVYIEAIVIRDLIAGRCGLLKSSSSRFDRDEVLKRIHICDVLEQDIIPDVASALRACASVIEPSFVPIHEAAMFDGSLPDL